MPQENPAYTDEEKASFRNDPDHLPTLHSNLAEAFGIFANAVVDSELGRDQDDRGRVPREPRRQRARPGAARSAAPDVPRRLQAPDHLAELLRRDPAAQRRARHRLASSASSRTACGRGDGRLHELDVLVLATGFKADAFMRPMRITGRDGTTLDEAWTPRPDAYLSVSIPDFPNFFMLNGPNGPVGNFSLIEVAGAAVRATSCSSSSGCGRRVSRDQREPRSNRRARGGANQGRAEDGVGHRLQELVPRRPRHPGGVAVVVRTVPERRCARRTLENFDAALRVRTSPSYARRAGNRGVVTSEPARAAATPAQWPRDPAPLADATTKARVGDAATIRHGPGLVRYRRRLRRARSDRCDRSAGRVGQQHVALRDQQRLPSKVAAGGRPPANRDRIDAPADDCDEVAGDIAEERFRGERSEVAVTGASEVNRHASTVRIAALPVIVPRFGSRLRPREDGAARAADGWPARMTAVRFAHAAPRRRPTPRTRPCGRRGRRWPRPRSRHSSRCWSPSRLAGRSQHRSARGAVGHPAARVVVVRTPETAAVPRTGLGHPRGRRRARLAPGAVRCRALLPGAADRRVGRRRAAVAEPGRHGRVGRAARWRWMSPDTSTGRSSGCSRWPSRGRARRCSSRVCVSSERSVNMRRRKSGNASHASCTTSSRTRSR